MERKPKKTKFYQRGSYPHPPPYWIHPKCEYNGLTLNNSQQGNSAMPQCDGTHYPGKRVDGPNISLFPVDYATLTGTVSGQVFELPPTEYKFTANGALSPPNTEKESRGRQQNVQKERIEGHSMLKKLSNAIILALEKAFYKLGWLVGNNPVKVIVICIVTCLFFFIGFIRYELNQDFFNLVIPSSSRLPAERDWVNKNVPTEQRPVRMIVEGDNVLSKNSLLAINNLYKTSFSYNFGDQSLETFCLRVNSRLGGNCVVNSILELWLYNETVIKSLTEEDILIAVNNAARSPLYFSDFDVNRIFGDIQRDTNGRIIGAKATVITWLLESTDEIKSAVESYERKMITLAENGDPAFKEIHPFTLNAYDDEFFSAVNDDILLLAFGFPLVGGYVVSAMGKFNMLQHKVHVAVSAFVGVMLSTGVSFGLCLATGLVYGATHNALAFLMLAIGVDDAFVIIESWKNVMRECPGLPIPERIALAMKHAGVSIIVTSLAELAAFASGIATNIPVLRSFCVYASVGIVALFILQATFFPACLTLDQKRVEQSRNACFPCYVHKNFRPGRCNQTEFVRRFFRNILGPALTSIPGKIAVLLLTMGATAAMSYGVLRLERGFDLEKGIRKGSTVRKYLEAQRIFFSTEGPAVEVYCGEMSYFDNIKQLDVMVEEYKLKSSVFEGAVISWIEPYKQWLALQNQMGENITVNSDGFPSQKEVFYQTLHKFVYISNLGAPFQNHLIFINDSNSKLRIRLSRFFMQLFNYNDGNVLIETMEEIRSAADNAGLTGGSCFAYSEFFVFVEMIELVSDELLRNFMLAGSAVFIVTLLLIVDLRVSFFVFLCVILTTLDVAGALSYTGITLDGNIVFLLTFCIGLGVDFSAHIGYMFMTVTGTRSERIQKTLVDMGPAVFHGGFTTILAFVTSGFAKSYSLQLFFKTFMLVVLFGLFHGLLMLPVLLSIIGPPPYDNAGSDERRLKTWWHNHLLQAGVLRNDRFIIPRPRLKNEGENRFRRINK